MYRNLISCLLISICSVPVVAQNVGINTTTPLAKLHVDIGASLSDGILFSGLDPSGGSFPSLGAGHRLMYYPGRGVFRAGYVDDTQWDNSQVGAFSFAFGYNTIARGNGSTAFGDGVYAGGTISTAFGNSTTTKGYSSFVMGMYNDPLLNGPDQDVETPQTPLFMVGNGDGVSTRNNALTVFKNGDALFRNYYTVNADPGSQPPPVSGPGTRIMWMSKKSAFRVGTVTNEDWNADSIGTWSTGIGYNTKAQGQFSLALGVLTTASGTASTAMGYGTKAIMENATSMGSFTSALGVNSTAIGYKTNAGSFSSVSMGRHNDTIVNANRTDWINTDPLFIIGNGSSDSARHNAMVVYKNGNMILKNPNPFYYYTIDEDYPIPVSGEGTRLMWLPEISAFRVGTVSDTSWDSANIGLGSFGAGFNSIASGDASTAFGFHTTASGAFSMAAGLGIQAKGYSSLAIGYYNDPIVTSDQSDMEPTTPLFLIGNGDGDDERRNVMVARKDGHVGVGTNDPITTMHIDVKDNPSDGFLVEGEFDLDAAVPNIGPGSRMVFFPGKSAFRVGTVNSYQWDDFYVGRYSNAMGYGTIASGAQSFAVGASTIASGFASVAMGLFTEASQQSSFAVGNSTIASGLSSSAMGENTVASGPFSIAVGFNSVADGTYSSAFGYYNFAKSEHSTAFGIRTIAKGFATTVIGTYNDSILTTNQYVIDPTTPLFIVGNGDGDAPGQRKNAMVVRKDGRVGIGSNTPATQLTVIGPAGSPILPDVISTGILRVALNTAEGIDIGKMDSGNFAGWIQVGASGEVADPLSLQPVGGKVGIGTTSPASSAVLDVSSTNKGFLPPRLTYSNRNTISSPAAGLMIWCSDCGVYGQMQIYNGAFWSNLSGGMAVGEPVIGMHDGGGVIAYILQSGDPGYVPGETHGLIATIADVVPLSGVDWGCSGTNIPGAGGILLGTGQQNTTDIVNGCSSEYIPARICHDLVQNGFSDWYLPSKDELNKLYINRVAIGGFGDWYWSSSEVSTTHAWAQTFLGGTQSSDTKVTDYAVRAVRSF